MLDRNKVNILQVRSRLGPGLWRPATPFGDDGWKLDNKAGDQRIFISYHPQDGIEWIHASMSNRYEGLPSYDNMALLHRGVWGETGWSYEVHAPVEAHINIHPRALHLWGRLDGKPALPNFGITGSI